MTLKSPLSLHSWTALSEKELNVKTKAQGPSGALPLSENLLLHSPSGDLFGMSQNVGMGWKADTSAHDNYLILSTLGGLRAEDGSPIALGYHTGHWELGLLIKEAALRIRELGAIPFAAHCSDPCDGRSQGTTGMFHSLAYRNDAAMVLTRLAGSLPLRVGIMGISSCDKGAPAMMMALASAGAYPGIFVPGGVTLPPEHGEDAGTVQTIGVRFAHKQISLKDASEMGCRACASPGGGCQFLGTAATAQVVAEALGISLPHSALCPSGEAIWLKLARDSADALVHLRKEGIKLSNIITQKALENAMMVHAAFGGSTNFLLHLPAIAYHAGLKRPEVQDWEKINRQVPRLVDVLPNGPTNYKTVQVYLAGGVPEVMLELRNLGLLHTDVMTVTGSTLNENLDLWEKSERRQFLRARLESEDGASASDVVLTLDKAKAKGLTSTVVFPKGNIAPQGSVVKATSISPKLMSGAIYEKIGPARVFVSEEAAMKAVKENGNIKADDIIVLLCRGPLGAGFPETYQITSALKYAESLFGTALITDGRFSGVSTGPCIGHIGPEALAKGPIGKVIDGDILRIYINRESLHAEIDLIGEATTPEKSRSKELGEKILKSRPFRADLAPDPELPDEVKLWAHLQSGTWSGCVYDTKDLIKRLS